MKEQSFRISPYTKRELARLYFPVANLRNLFKRNKELMDSLQKSGYNPHNKCLTPRQVRLIVDYLGEP